MTGSFIENEDSKKQLSLSIFMLKSLMKSRKVQKDMIEQMV